VLCGGELDAPELADLLICESVLEAPKLEAAEPLFG
jgi:hypothetical protein